MRTPRRPIAGDPDAYRFRTTRRSGAAGLRSVVSGMAAPRGYTITSQTTLSAGGGAAGSGGFSSSMPIPGSPYSPGDTSADDSTDPATGARYFTYGFSKFGSAHITGP